MKFFLVYASVLAESTRAVALFLSEDAEAGGSVKAPVRVWRVMNELGRF